VTDVVLLCYCARHFTLKVPRSTLGTEQFNAGVNPGMDQHPIQGGIQMFAIALCRLTLK